MTADLVDQLVVSTQTIIVEIEHKILGVVEDPTADFNGYIAFGSSEFDEPQDNFSSPPWNAAAWITRGTRYGLTLLLGPKNSGVILPGTIGDERVWHVFVGLDGQGGVLQCPILYAGPRTIR